MARSSTNLHQPEHLSRSGFQPYRPDDGRLTHPAGVYPTSINDAYPSAFSTMPIPGGKH